MKIQDEMTFEEFLRILQERVLVTMGTDYSVESMTVLKNNGLRLTSLLIKKEGDMVVPNIYMNTYYDDYREGRELDELVHDVIRSYRFAGFTEIKEEDVTYGFQNLNTNVVFRLVNYEKNRELLQMIPHIKLLDFAITYHNIVNMDQNGISSIRVTKEHQRQWGISSEDLLFYAKRNTSRLFPASLKTMEEVMKDIMMKDVLDISVHHISEEEEAGDLIMKAEQSAEEFLHMFHNSSNQKNTINMYVLSNALGINGASCMLYPEVLHNFAKTIKSDFYILPSSIHEVILVPYDDSLDPKELKKMVIEINQSQVPVDEVLSDEIYQYSQIANRLFI